MTAAGETAVSPRRDVDLCQACERSGTCGVGITDLRVLDDGSVAGEFVVPDHARGMRVAHGGWTSWVFDEFLGLAATAQGVWAVTSQLQIDFRRPVPIGATVVVTARCASIAGRRMQMTGGMRLATTNAVLAEATGVWVRLPDADAHYARAAEWAAGEGVLE